MYAVILAGGGGTRLHPLSRPELPKPFLPLVTAETLLQSSVARVRDIAASVTVVTERRYEHLVRAQVPGVAVLTEPLGRNTAAAIALAALAIDRPDDDVMLVLPADQMVERLDVFQAVLRTAATSLAPGSFDIDSPLVTLGVQVARPATEFGYLIPDVGRAQRIDGVEAYPLLRFEEKPKPAQAEELGRQVGVAWNAGMFLWRRRAIVTALQRYTGLIQSLGPMVASPQLLDRAYESIQRAVSIDYAVMESAARNGSVVMASMDVGWSDLGSWSALLAAIGARGSGAVVQAGETVPIETDDLVVRRVGG